MAKNEKVLEEIKNSFPDDVLDMWEDKGEGVVVVKESALYKIAEHLHTSPSLKFDLMANMTVVDYLNIDPRPYETRFVGVYHFYSMDFSYRLRVKVSISDPDKGLTSVTGIWKSAGFFEREAYDMFGIKFEGNPDMRRIYMPENWKGHPLRKDYPIMGYDEGKIDINGDCE